MSRRENVVRVASSAPPRDGAGDNALAAATLVVAKARAECMNLGLSPRQFADLILPESLLAMMVDGMSREEVEAAFEEFSRDHIGPWFFREKRITGFCDCARDAAAEHASDCAIHHFQSHGETPTGISTRDPAGGRTSKTKKAAQRSTSSNHGPTGPQRAKGGSK